MVVIASGKGGGGGVGNAGAWCDTGISGMATMHHAAHANHKTIQKMTFLSLHNCKPVIMLTALDPGKYHT